MPRISLIGDYLASELKRAGSQLTPRDWQSLLVGVGDRGEIAAYPCRLILPFHYPSTVDELDEYGPDHFTFPQESWKLRWQEIPEFAAQYAVWSKIDDDAQSLRVSQRHRRDRIQALQEACASLDPKLTIFGVESDSEEWWEPNTFHLSGPRLPAPPPPVSDVQILTRLCRQTHSYIGRSRFQIDGNHIVAAAFDGADTTDSTVDLLRGVPRLKELLARLQKLSFQHTLLTPRSLRFLARELPHVEITYSPNLEE